MELRKYPEADVRKKTDIFFMVGLVVALGITYASFSYTTKDEVVQLLDTAKVADEAQEMVEITRQEKPPTPPPPPPQTIEVVEDDAEVEESTFEENEMDQDDEIEEVQEQVEVQEQTQEPEIFTVVEDMPSFPGGEAKMMQYIADNLEYPPYAKDNLIQGRVIIGFVVDESGKITDVKILKDIGGGCGEAAAKVVKSMPRWSPGKQRNKPVRVRYTIPVKFQLE